MTPHWLEFSDRFWYDYETPAGRRWWIVDPIKKTKTPLFDNAKMAAQLTRILRTPYDAQHLPITHDPVHRERHEDPLQRHAAA